MSDNNSTQLCVLIQFCFGHIVTETFSKLQETVFCQELRFSVGLRHPQKAETGLKMNLAAEETTGTDENVARIRETMWNCNFN